jgi:hypothetical protein
VLHPGAAQHDIAGWGQVRGAIQSLACITKMLGERAGSAIECREDEAAIDLDVRGPQTEMGTVDVGADRKWNIEEIAFLTIDPAMILAGERTAIAAFELAQQVAAMTAPVRQNVNAVIVPRQDDRLDADRPADEVSALGKLRLVSDIDLSLPKDAIHLEIEDRRVGVEPAVHRRRADKLGNIRGHSKPSLTR